MGMRNPFRFSIDSQTGWLYFGDVGPDAESASPTRGPRGYDEINRARQAGNYGWPYCVADNEPYIDYDFDTGLSGTAFDCAAPANDSPNNTGSLTLPPARGPCCGIRTPSLPSEAVREPRSPARSIAAGQRLQPRVSELLRRRPVRSTTGRVAGSRRFASTISVSRRRSSRSGNWRFGGRSTWSSDPTAHSTCSSGERTPTAETTTPASTGSSTPSLNVAVSANGPSRGGLRGDLPANAPSTAGGSGAA